MAEPASGKRRMTLEEFYAWAETQEEPYEFVDGEPVPLFPEQDENGVIRAMAAGTADHHQIQFNAGKAIDARRPAGCSVLTGARIRTGEQRSRDPDVVMACGWREKGLREVPDPVLVVEILSPSTADHDRGQKLDEYRLLPSLREIWFVDSTRRAVTVLRRVPEGWLLTDHIGRGSFRSAVLDAEIGLDELYADTPV